MSEETRKQTTVRIDEALLKAVKVEDATGVERLSLTDAIDQGIRLVLAQRKGQRPSQPSELDGLTKEDRALATRVIAFLRSDSPHKADFRKITTDMLNVFNRLKP